MTDQDTQKPHPSAKDAPPNNDAPTPYIRSPRKAVEEEQTSSLWLITFTDVMALMLTFFVLLYAMSVPVEEEWKDITNGITNQFVKKFSAESAQGAQDSINIDKVDFSKAQSLSYLNSVLVNVIERNENLKNVKLIPQKDHLIISIPQELLFQGGQAQPSNAGRAVLYTLASAITRIKNRIEIIGHTDPRPIEGTSPQNTFQSNWELSLARAGNVASALKNGGYEKPIMLRGFSSARYDDLLDDMNETEKLSLSRRVDIVIMQDNGNQRGIMNLKF